MGAIKGSAPRLNLEARKKADREKEIWQLVVVWPERRWWLL